MLRVGDQPEVPLLPVTDLEYFVIEGQAKVIFEKDGSGKVASFKVWQGGQEFTGKKKQ
jgi:hypothetical protein